MGAKALEEERGAGRPGAHRSREAQGIVPVGRDPLFVGAPADERREHRPCAGRSQGVEASLGQAGNAQGKVEADEVGQGEVVIADAAAIGVMGEDAQVGLVIEQAVDDIGGLAGGRDGDRVVRRLAGREVR